MHDGTRIFSVDKAILNDMKIQEYNDKFINFRKGVKKMISKKIVALVVVSLFILATNGCPLSPAPVPRTGQTASYATGDDGDLQKGVAWPNPRFTDNGDGTVTDNLTGLIWLKDANCFGARTWNNALSDANGLSAGFCGLTDGSSAGDWRLPNYKELFSLIDASNYGPALPTGHPFTNVQSGVYRSATTVVQSTGTAWGVSMVSGSVYNDGKSNNHYVWPVRGGQ